MVYQRNQWHYNGVQGNQWRYNSGK
jgi:hypothetical protein